MEVLPLFGCQIAAVEIPSHQPTEFEKELDWTQSTGHQIPRSLLFGPIHRANLLGDTVNKYLNCGVHWPFTFVPGKGSISLKPE